jgi:hypothetical protein
MTYEEGVLTKMQTEFKNPIEYLVFLNTVSQYESIVGQKFRDKFCWI